MKYFDLHCGTISNYYTDKKTLFDSDMQILLLRGKKYSPWFQCFTVWISHKKRGKTAAAYFDSVLQKLEYEIKLNTDKIMLCKAAFCFSLT